ncbi:type III secretion system chaperone [Candidatus Similichlamydia epinepheli]|uniref:type III secretion system chaperone n=1 Tax=Candidatus Similichlamydia epinepheli TaxID=1903953 RepID=UPI000D3D209B|nr:type III secretion system chaperone [Candidatus Similichlamydia epinepheli]
MYYLPFENLIKELSERWTGSTIELNGSSSCEIKTEEGLLMSIEADTKDPVIQVICFLGLVSKTKESNALFIRLLQENLSPNEDEVFGIDPTSGQFTLHRSISLETISADSLVLNLLRLHNKGIEWSQVILGEKPLPVK